MQLKANMLNFLKQFEYTYNDNRTIAMTNNIK